MVGVRFKADGKAEGLYSLCECRGYSSGNQVPKIILIKKGEG